MSGPIPRTLAAVALALAAACAGAPPSPRAGERAAATAWPEPDPACRVVVARSLALNGLEQVTVRAGLGADGRPSLLQVLGPELSPAAAEEVRRAFADCAWKPAPDGAMPAVITFGRR